MIKSIYDKYYLIDQVVMRIHALFILKESGAYIYKRFYTDQFKQLNVDLITPFFSAIFSFSKSVMSKELEILEMGELRFVFRKDKGYIFVLLASEQENLIFLYSRLEKVAKEFFKILPSLQLEENQTIDNDAFDSIADPIIYGEDDVFFSDDKEKKRKNSMLIDYLRTRITQNEIKGAALVTMEGNLLYTTLSEKVLNRAMREIETRYLTRTLDLPETFCTLKNGQKVCERIINFTNTDLNLLLIIEFEKQTTLGMAEWISEEISSKIKKYNN